MQTLLLLHHAKNNSKNVSQRRTIISPVTKSETISTDHSSDITFILQEKLKTINVKSSDYPCLIDLSGECKIILDEPEHDTFLVITLENVDSQSGILSIYHQKTKLLGAYDISEYSALNFLYVKSQNRFVLC